MSEKECRCEELETENARLRERVEKLMLQSGQRLAANAVWMQLASHLARNGQQELAQRFLKAADNAAANVRLEDFVIARVNSTKEKDE